MLGRVLIGVGGSVIRLNASSDLAVVKLSSDMLLAPDLFVCLPVFVVQYSTVFEVDLCSAADYVQVRQNYYSK